MAELRQPLLVGSARHSKGHLTGLAFFQQVLPTHQSLQFRKFTHHLANQIVLAEMSRTPRMAGRVSSMPSAFTS